MTNIQLSTENLSFTYPDGTRALKNINIEIEKGEKVDVVIRPEDWDVVPLEKAKLTGKVTSSIFKGVYYEICADILGMEMVIHAYEDVPVSSTIGLRVDPYEIHLMKVKQNEQ